MNEPITLNTVISTSGVNSVLKYRLPTAINLKNKEVALTSIGLYYSWFNITSAFGNNKCSYTWSDGTVTNITFPDGYYSVTDISAYIQFIMYGNKHYLVDTTNGANIPVYYLSLQTNATYYGIQLSSTPVPVALPTNYTLPSGASWTLPLTAKTPLLTVPANAFTGGIQSSFSTVLGFVPATYPSVTQATVYSVLSTFTPQVAPITTITVTCDLASSPISRNPKTIFTFSPNPTQTPFGSYYQYNSTFPVYYPVPDNAYREVNVSLLDDAEQSLVLRDPQGFTITMNIRDRQN